jgi:hypothetical protein
MNMTLRIVTKTSGNETTHIPEVLLRGGFVRFMCMPPDIGELVRKTREEATGSSSRAPFRPAAEPVRGSARGGGSGERGASEGRGGYYRGNDRSRGHYR